MLHIIVTVLKILGTVLLVILAILAVLLLLLLAVLSSPIRYHLKGGYHGEVQFAGRITCLFRILRISVKYMGNEMDLQIAIFGHVLGSGSKTTRWRKKKKKEKTDDSETIFSAAETKTSSENLKPSGVLPSEEPDAQDLSSDEPGEQELPSDEPDLSSEEPDEPDFSSEEPDEPDFSSEEPDEPDLSFEEPDDMDMPSEPQKEKNTIPETVKKVIRFLQMPSVKKLIGKLFKSLKKIIGHLLPDELKIRGTVGFDDPTMTGRAMEAAAVLYAFYPDQIQITPSFDEEVLECEAELKGKIVLLYLLIKGIGMVLHVFLNKECKSFYREMKQQMSA